MRNGVDMKRQGRLDTVYMQRLSILIGIGLMLVGSMSYALPDFQDASALFPAIAGIVIATVAFICRHHDRVAKYLIYVNGMASVLLLVWACLRVAVDMFFPRSDSLMLATDLDTIGLSCVLLFYTMKKVLQDLFLDRQEKEALRTVKEK